MYIVDGIAYAGEQTTPLKVSGVRPMEDYKLWLRFSNGEARIVDFKPLLKDKAFAPLADVAIFNSVYIDYGVPVWLDGDIDIGPDFLYENSVPQDAASA
jgi:hypothetical protein